MFITPISLHLDWRIVLTWSKKSSFPKNLPKSEVWKWRRALAMASPSNWMNSEVLALSLLKTGPSYNGGRFGRFWMATAISTQDGGEVRVFPLLLWPRGRWRNWPGEEGYNLGRRAPGEQRFLQVVLDKEINIEAIYFGNLLRYSMLAILQIIYLSVRCNLWYTIICIYIFSASTIITLWSYFLSSFLITFSYCLLQFYALFWGSRMALFKEG